MRLEGFDVVFGLATPAIDLFIEHASVSLVQIGDDEARVGPFGASLDAGDDALDAAPASGAVEELLEAADFVVSWRGLEARLRAGLEDFDVSAHPMLPLPGLSPASGKPVVVKFDGGLLSSDGGVLALREVEQRLRLADRLAASSSISKFESDHAAWSSL